MCDILIDIRWDERKQMESGRKYEVSDRQKANIVASWHASSSSPVVKSALRGVDSTLLGTAVPL